MHDVARRTDANRESKGRTLSGSTELIDTRMAEVAQRIVESSAFERLHYRHSIAKLARRLQNSRSQNLYFFITDLGGFASDSERALALGGSLAHALDLQASGSFSYVLDAALDQLQEHARLVAFDLDYHEALRDALLQRDIFRDSVIMDQRDSHDLPRHQQLSQDHQSFGVGLQRALSQICEASQTISDAFFRNFDLNFSEALNAALDLSAVRESIYDLTLIDTFVVARVISFEAAYCSDGFDRLTHIEITFRSGSLAGSGARLEAAAHDFRGEDLRRAPLEGFDLAWIRWDEHTEWPESWADRIRNASTETPKGSGQYVVLPAPERDSVMTLVGS
ncbi:hypothetical protein ACFVYG_23980 [Streptomyces sp. NPDC058256]|uniref:hypothetical protein n=1 Tax=Streptomyces sp. NPDC058256 TaxID=3346408 RepID=UPI0036EBD3D6